MHVTSPTLINSCGCVVDSGTEVVEVCVLSQRQFVLEWAALSPLRVVQLCAGSFVNEPVINSGR
jgi:hypothetical protein